MTTPHFPHPTWLDDYAIPPGTAGVVLAVDFGETGVWMARLNPDLGIAEAITESRITPTVLDLRTAAQLRDTGAIAGVDNDAAFAELVTLCGRARGTLVERDSAMVMGDEHLRLVTVSLETLMTATLPEVNRAHGMIVELAGREPVAALFVGPGTDLWPGLWESLTDRGFSLLTPEDPFPVTFAGDEDATHVLDPVDSGAVTSLAWAAEAPDELTTLVPTESAPTPDPGRRRTKTVLAAAAVGVVALTGAGIAVASMSGKDGPSLPPTAAPGGAGESGSEAVSTTGSEAAPTTAEPADLRAARATMRRYTAPPTTRKPPPTSEATTGPEPQPERKPRPRDHRRTIPNPIPGLPPIIIG